MNKSKKAHSKPKKRRNKPKKAQDKQQTLGTILRKRVEALGTLPRSSFHALLQGG